MKTLTLIHQEYPTSKHLFPLSFYLGSWGEIRTSHFLQLISCFTLGIYHFALPVCISRGFLSLPRIWPQFKIFTCKT